MFKDTSLRKNLRKLRTATERTPVPVLVHGLLSGWLATLLLARSELVRFIPGNPATAGILNSCIMQGYPKQKDYFWFAAIVLAGWAGAVVGSFLHRILTKAGWRGLASGFPHPAGLAFLITAFVLAFSRDHSTSPVTISLAAAGAILPWLDRSWFVPAPPTASWTRPNLKPVAIAACLAVGLVLAAFWIYDPRIDSRPLDGHHEGIHLMQVQSALSGDLPGVDTKVQYGPLYTHSLIWWMRWFGMTVSSERRYFIAAQVIGTLIHFLLLRLLCRGWLALGLGTWLILMTSTAAVVQYGWANAMRTALPLLALYQCARGLEAERPGYIAVSGALLAVSILYSPEFGWAGMMGCSLVFVATFLRRRPVIRPLAWWACSFSAVSALALIAMFGIRAGEAILALADGGYALARIAGFAVIPMPAFPWWTGPAQIVSNEWKLLWVAQMWGPAVLLGAMGALLLARRVDWAPGNFPLAASLLVFATIAQIPVVNRPHAQAVTSALPLILLASIATDDLWAAGGVGRRTAGALVACLAVIAWSVPLGGMHSWLDKYSGPPPDPVYTGSGSERLGRIIPSIGQAAVLREVTPLLQRLCRPRERVYCAMLENSYLCFLSGRAALAPFPLANQAATPADRRQVLRSLEKARPPLAFIELKSIDVPYTEERKEEWGYIRRHYALLKKVGPILIYTRR